MQQLQGLGDGLKGACFLRDATKEASVVCAIALPTKSSGSATYKLDMLPSKYGLAVPTERAPPSPPEPAEEGADDETAVPASLLSEPEDLGVDPTMASIAQAFLAIASSSTPADPGFRASR